MSTKTKFSFDPACLELARHFYPNEPEPMLHVLAQEFQDSAERFIPELRSDLTELLRDVQSGSARNGAASADGAESTATLANS